MPPQALQRTKENKNAMADRDEKKCANAVCTCPADEGSNFCSAYCEGIGKNTTTIDCNCGCPSCGTNI
jgi:hypothetical protein